MLNQTNCKTYRGEIIEKWRLANEEHISTTLHQLTLRLNVAREDRAKEGILSTLYFTQIRERREHRSNLSWWRHHNMPRS
jgi:hypothetical protein